MLLTVVIDNKKREKGLLHELLYANGIDLTKYSILKKENATQEFAVR